MPCTQRARMQARAHTQHPTHTLRCVPLLYVLSTLSNNTCSFLQVLPFCSEETLQQLEANLSGLPSVTKLLQSGASPQDITDMILKGIGNAGNPLVVTPR